MLHRSPRKMFLSASLVQVKVELSQKVSRSVCRPDSGRRSRRVAAFKVVTFIRTFIGAFIPPSRDDVIVPSPPSSPETACHVVVPSNHSPFIHHPLLLMYDAMSPCRRSIAE